MKNPQTGEWYGPCFCCAHSKENGWQQFRCHATKPRIRKCKKGRIIRDNDNFHRQSRTWECSRFERQKKS